MLAQGQVSGGEGAGLCAMVLGHADKRQVRLRHAKASLGQSQMLLLLRGKQAAWAALPGRTCEQTGPSKELVLPVAGLALADGTC